MIKMNEFEKHLKPYTCRLKINVSGPDFILESKVSRSLIREFNKLEDVKLVEDAYDYILDIEPKYIRQDDGSKGDIIIKIVILKTLFDKLKYLQLINCITIKNKVLKGFYNSSYGKIYVDSWVETTTIAKLKDDCKGIVNTFDRYIIEANRESHKLL